MAGQSDEEILEEAQERFDRAKEYQQHAHEMFRRDMKFANGTDDNYWQWDDDVRTARGNRPCLTINKTRIHNLQCVNDSRQNPAQVRISPVGDQATYEAAQIFQGVCRHIEYISNAQAAYGTATYNQVFGGIGYWRVLTDYVDDDTCDQDIFIRRIPNPLDVYLDPDIQQYDGSDAKWGFIFYEMDRKEFNAKYGKKGDDEAPVVGSGPLNNTGHYQSDDEHVRLVEYYRRGEDDDRLYELVDGTCLRHSELPDGALEQLNAQRLIERWRSIKIPSVEWFLIADNDKILDRKPWPGKYVPIVRVPCEEVVIDGRVDWVSHTRHLRDAQRLYNWYSSSAAEFVALQTKSPYVGTAEAVGPYKEMWERSNVENMAVLLYQGYDPDTGQQQPPPERSQPPVMAAAYMQGLQIAQQEMMMATGQYQAVMGQPSNETSGVAINARQRQGDNATYHIIDHLASAIRFTGRILVDLIPRVYDTARVIMIIGEDGSESAVHVDPSHPVAHEVTQDPSQPQQTMNQQGGMDTEAAVRTIWNPNIGRYAVMSDVGPAYATKRQQAFDAFSNILAKNPAAFQVMGDFWAKSADFPGSDELAERLQKGLPPQYADGPDPQVQQLQQALQQTNAHANQVLQQADAEIASLKGENARLQEQMKEKADQIEIDRYKAESDRFAKVGGIDPNALKPIIREMVSQILGTHAIPIMQAHAAADQAMMPPEPAPTNGAAGNA